MRFTYRTLRCAVVIMALVMSPTVYAIPPQKWRLMLAPGTLTGKSVAVLWDKQANETISYTIFLNGKLIGSTTKTDYQLQGLKPATIYVLTVKMVQEAGRTAQIRFKTPAQGKVFNILDYGAKGDSGTLNTKAIQAAIDACTPGGTVYIPKGTFVSGALYLRSNMTLYIEKGAVLKGSINTEDYLPMYLNRFEGWELKTYASLLNAGTLDRREVYPVRNLRIMGQGMIMGGGRKLGDAMIKASGMRSRGRLICLMNVENVAISGLTITEPPCWTIHYIYSRNVTCNGLNIVTYGIRNGDGIDPDSSIDSYIFNCTFNTGDDCIAIKSGKNPEGYLVARPTQNVRITNCDFIKGHGISIGSEMSGGVSNVLVQDCKAGALLHGMQIKGTKDRGGYVRNVTVDNCQLQQITVFTSLNYNNDGAPAPELPVFEQFRFTNIDLTGAGVKEPAIDINGFKDPAHRLRNVTFDRITLPAKSRIVIRDAENIQFDNISLPDGVRPDYIIENSINVWQDGKQLSQKVLP